MTFRCLSRLAIPAAVFLVTLAVVIYHWSRLDQEVLAPRGADTSQYVGAARCAQCHQEISAEQSCSRMATTLHTTAEYQRRHRLPVPAEVLDPANQLRYRILRKEGTLWLEAWRGREVARAEMSYALGSGKVAVTFVRELDAQNYQELRASYYADTDTWDLTPGQRGARPATVTEALGRPIDKRGETACLTCHASLLVQSEGRVDTERSLFGVDCERCHGPGRQHVESALTGTPDKLRPPEVIEALRLVQQGSVRSPQTPQEELLKVIAESHDERLLHDLYVCGECHGYQQLWRAASADELTKFQVAALVGSPCYQRSQTKIRCSDCHDAHGDSPASDAADHAAVCLQCHGEQAATKSKKPERQSMADAELTAGAVPANRTCPVSPGDGCIACHMPIRSPIPHTRFTHHRIGIYQDRGAQDP